MKITDYESGRSLKDVGLQLNVEQATELRDYLNRLISEPQVSNAYLTVFSDRGIEKELSIRIERDESELVSTSRRLPLPRTRPLVAV